MAGTAVVRVHGTDHCSCLSSRLHVWRTNVTAFPTMFIGTSADGGGSREPNMLIAGKRFHRDVQAAYVAGLTGVTKLALWSRP